MKVKSIRNMFFGAAIGLISACATTNHNDQGMMFVNQGDMNNAIAEFKMAIAQSPSAQAYSNLGATYMQVGKLNLAMDALKSGEKLNDKHIELNYNLTALHSLMDQTDLALEYLSKTLGLGFENYDALRFDSDLENLRGEPEFRSTLESHKIFIQ